MTPLYKHMSGLRLALKHSPVEYPQSALLDLKSASRCWFARPRYAFSSSRYRSARSSDACIFISRNSGQCSRPSREHGSSRLKVTKAVHEEDPPHFVLRENQRDSSLALDTLAGHGAAIMCLATQAVKQLKRPRRLQQLPVPQRSLLRPFYPRLPKVPSEQMKAGQRPSRYRQTCRRT